MGVTLMWFGAWLHSNIGEIDVDNSETLVATVIVLLGAVLLVMAVFGCAATYMESKSMLISVSYDPLCKYINYTYVYFPRNSAHETAEINRAVTE